MTWSLASGRTLLLAATVLSPPSVLCSSMILSSAASRCARPHTLRRGAGAALSRRAAFAARALSSSPGGGTGVGVAGDECPLPFETLPYRGAEVRVPADEGGGGDRDDGGDDDGRYRADAELLDRLRGALDYWIANDYTSAWVHVPSSRARLLERLTAPSCSSSDGGSSPGGVEGDADVGGLDFELHHVNATDGVVVVKRWLRPEAEDKVPPFATHQVGCAGFVLSDENELLLVREWTGPPSDRVPTRQWKLPGGLLDMGESFEEASCREVWEETGVRCEFESVLAFWHRHGLVFGKSDFYFVCLLRPKSREIQICPAEVSDAVWMPVEEFMRTQDHPLIWHVLRNVFRVGNGDDEGGDKNGLTEGRLKPVVEIAEGHVQFRNRMPFPTYTGSITQET